MIIFSLVSWWYGAGWLTLLHKIEARIRGVLGFFSVPLLAGSLFAPFRQIAAGRVNGSLSVMVQAWADRTFSRAVGFVVRSFLIVIGLLTVVLVAAVGFGMLLLWPFVPLLPLAGVVLLGMGV